LTEYLDFFLTVFASLSCKLHSSLHAEVWTQALRRNINQFITAVHLSSESDARYFFNIAMQWQRLEKENPVKAFSFRLVQNLANTQLTFQV